MFPPYLVNFFFSWVRTSKQNLTFTSSSDFIIFLMRAKGSWWFLNSAQSKHTRSIDQHGNNQTPTWATLVLKSVAGAALHKSSKLLPYKDFLWNLKFNFSNWWIWRIHSMRRIVASCTNSSAYLQKGKTDPFATDTPTLDPEVLIWVCYQMISYNSVLWEKTWQFNQSVLFW